MRKISTFVAVVLMLVSTASVMAQLRGKGRLQGTVVDKQTGTPIAGATISINIADGSTSPIVVKSNDKGRWSALGMSNGSWNIDIDADGYQPSRVGPVAISETQTLPSRKIELEKLAVQEQVPEVVAPMGSSVPQEAVDAIKEAEQLLSVNGGDVISRTEVAGVGETTSVSRTVTPEDVVENARKAAALMAKALPQIPSETPELQTVRLQVQQRMAQAYYRAGDVRNAIGLLEAISAADPANIGVALLLTNLYLENGQLEEGKARLAGLPADAVTDPTVYVNIGILFLNKNNPEDAAVNFGKAVEMDMTQPASYYYRGLANLQLKKMKEAKADFEKVISLAPDSTEARDAKQLLDSMK